MNDWIGFASITVTGLLGALGTWLKLRYDAELKDVKRDLSEAKNDLADCQKRHDDCEEKHQQNAQRITDLEAKVQ